MTLPRTELEGSLRRSDADIRPTMPANVLMIGNEKYSVVGLVSTCNSFKNHFWCLIIIIILCAGFHGNNN
jgi:hypothetical protein